MDADKHGERRTEKTAYLVVDTESVPDGDLISRVKYPKEMLEPRQAIDRAQKEARESSWNQSDFLPVTFQIPVSICVARVGQDFRLQSVRTLDAPAYRTEEMTRQFWTGVNHYNQAKIVTFNGRGFDLPLLELAAFRYGLSMPRYYQRGRNRFSGDLDLMDWLTNFGAYRLPGGLNLLAKLLGLPGKMELAGDQVYQQFLQGDLKSINEYCMFDTLDTYFVFLRTRVLTGEITLAEEDHIVAEAKDWLASHIPMTPALGQYLAHWQRHTPTEP